MKLFLIRHGQTPWTVTRRYQGTSDVPLSPRGLQEARAVALTLKDYPLTRLYTSTLQRAYKTARVIGNELGLRPVADSRLNEIHFGKWEGIPHKRLMEEGSAPFRKWCEGKLKRPPGGESIDSLGRRVDRFLRELIKSYPEENIAVVSHGGPIKMFLFRILKGFVKQAAALPSIWSFRIDPASISLVEGNANLLQIVWTNHTHHLNSK